jgi:hypothetical protein
MTKDEALQMALDAMVNRLAFGAVRYEQAIEAIRTALAQPEPEPVAWFNSNEAVDAYALSWHKKETHDTPLYTAPPKREWVGLTHKDYWELVQKTMSFNEVVEAIEAKLKEKNYDL